MRKNLFLFFLGLFFLNNLTAQQSIQINLPSSGFILKSQLWNVVVLNNSNTPITDCKLEIIVRNIETGLDQVSAVSSNFILPVGAKQISERAIGPVRYNTTGQIIIRNSEEFLPIGKYTVCYTLLKNDIKTVVLAEDCSSLDIQPLSPPNLVFPLDSSILKQVPQQFSWVPPTPYLLFKELNYEFSIVEVLPNQNANDAIENNVPFFNTSNLKNNNFSYSISYPLFEKGKWYAWRVVANNDNNYSIKSDVWTFQISDSVPKPQYEQIYYYTLEKASRVNTIIVSKNQKKLFLKHYSYDIEYSGELTILNLENKETISNKKVNIYYGENLFSIQLPASLHKEGTYMLTLKDVKNNDFAIKFKIEK